MFKGRHFEDKLVVNLENLIVCGGSEEVPSPSTFPWRDFVKPIRSTAAVVRNAVGAGTVGHLEIAVRDVVVAEEG